MFFLIAVGKVFLGHGIKKSTEKSIYGISLKLKNLFSNRYTVTSY